MPARIHEHTKVDVALKPQALNNTNATGKWFSMARFDELMIIGLVGAMAATKTATITLQQAKDADGTDAEDVDDYEAVVTANTNVTEATLTLATVLNGQTVTINGVTFTAHTDTTVAADRQFAIDGDNTADAAALAGLINDATYGVEGVTATANSAVITLTVDDPGSRTITASASDSTVTVATTQALAYVGALAENLSVNDGFTHVRAKVATTANSVVAATMLRARSRYAPDQAVGASAS